MSTMIGLPGVFVPTVEDQPWREKAKCLGQDWREYVVENLPKGRNAPATRAILAQAKCSGCPVKAECAGDALDNIDMGVIRGGVAIPASNGNEEYRNAKRKLYEASGRRYESNVKRRGVWPRQCERCKRQMRPQKSSIEEFPGTVVIGSKNICAHCKVSEWREKNGGRTKKS